MILETPDTKHHHGYGYSKTIAAFLNQSMNNFSTIPISTPNPMDPTISMTGPTKVEIRDTDSVMRKLLVIASAIPNTMMAMASSMATTGSNVSVTGPLALYCRITIRFAAGAVADAIAPIVRKMIHRQLLLGQQLQIRLHPKPLGWR